MTSASKAKGSRIEREVRDLHLALDIPAKKMPLSGALGGEYAGDLQIADRFIAEVKSRKGGQGFSMINKWLGDNDMLFLRANHDDVKVVLPWNVYVELLSAWTDLNGIHASLSEEVVDAAASV